MTVEHVRGEATIEVRPERVAVVGIRDQDAVLALGVTPVAVRGWFGDQPDAVWPWAQDELGDADPVVLPPGDIDVEQVASLDPDVIIGVDADLSAEQYALLSEVERAEQIAAVEGTVQAAAEAHPEFAESTALLGLSASDGQAYVYGPRRRAQPVAGRSRLLRPELELALDGDASTTPSSGADPGQAATMATSLEQVARHLGEVDGDPRLAVGPPAGEGWWTLAEATAGMHAWFVPLTEQYGDRRVAAAHVSSWLAGAPAVVVGLCAVLGGVVPRATPGRLWVHRHPGGWVDRFAVDPVDLHTGTGDDVLSAAGAHVAELAADVVERASAELPIGRTAVWGGLADAITAFVLMFSRQSGRDQQDDWRRCEALLDGLAHHAPLRVRPTPLPVEWSGGPSLYPVRGTCCLHYRTCDEPDPDGEGYCSTCPLRTAASRIRRLRDHLEASGWIAVSNGQVVGGEEQPATGRARRGSGARTG